MNETSSSNNTNGLKPYLSPLAVWALSVGSAIGWGSLVVTSSAYLSQAGPATLNAFMEFIGFGYDNIGIALLMPLTPQHLVIVLESGGKGHFKVG